MIQAAVPIILGLFKIASAYSTYNLQKTDTEKARSQDKYLAGLVRQDKLTQDKEDNDYYNSKLKLSQEEIDFKNRLSKDKVNFADKTDAYETKKLGRENIVNSVQSLKPTEDSWLFKSKIMGRY